MNCSFPKQLKQAMVVVACLMLASSTLFAQGSVIFCNNGSVLVFNSSTGQPVAMADGIKAALYWAPVGSSSFSQIGSVTNVGVLLPGLFAAGTRVSGSSTAGGAVGQFQVRAWGGGYATYEAAVAAGPGVLLGQSAVLQIVTGNPSAIPPTPGASLLSGGLQSFTLTPAVAPTSVDIGLRAYDGANTIKLAAAPAGQLTSSPFHINKNGTNFGILLVATNAANASKFRVETSSGIKAIQKLP